MHSHTYYNKYRYLFQCSLIAFSLSCSVYFFWANNFHIPHIQSAAVQHERKPIVDRKDGIISSAAGSVAGSSNSASGLNSSSTSKSSYQQQVRVKQQHQQQQQQHATSVAAAAAATAASAALFQHAATPPSVTNAATTPFGISENLFPMSLNFAELTQTLSKCSHHSISSSFASHSFSSPF